MVKLKSILVLSVILAFFGLWSYKTFADSHSDYVYLDNEFIQTYRDRDGLWIIPSKEKKTIVELISEFGTDEEDFLSINEIQEMKKIPKNQPFFIPYSDKYLSDTENIGRGREAVISNPDKLVWPVIVDKYSRITSRIGRRWNKFHTGIDISCRRGTVIVAAADGIVETSTWMGHYGKVLTIYHPEVSHTETLYAHNTHLLIKKGEKVKKGQIIAFSGTTGRSTGPHLHFEVRYQNIFLNPEHFLPEFPDNGDTIAVLD